MDQPSIGVFPMLIDTFGYTRGGDTNTVCILAKGAWIASPGHGIETTVDYMVHQTDGSRVVVVAIEHWGTELYFSQIEDLLSSLDVVIYEGLPRNEQDVLHYVTTKIEQALFDLRSPEEQPLYSLLESTQLMQRYMMERLKLIASDTGLPVDRPNWHSGDRTFWYRLAEDSEFFDLFVRNLHEAYAKVSVGASEQLLATIGRSAVRIAHNLWEPRDFYDYLSALYHPEIIRASAADHPCTKDIFWVFDCHRLPKESIGIVFGALHVPQILRELTARNYIQQNVSHRRAVPL